MRLLEHGEEDGVRQRAAAGTKLQGLWIGKRAPCLKVSLIAAENKGEMACLCGNSQLLSYLRALVAVPIEGCERQLKGTGFSPYIEPARQMGALAPDGIILEMHH